MPLTESGKSVMASMVKKYGKKRGEEIFYASIKANKAGSEKWHEPEKGMEIRKRHGGKKVHY